MIKELEEEKPDESTEPDIDDAFDELDDIAEPVEVEEFEETEIPGDLECVIMCHCTAHRAGISRAFGGRASTGRAGMTIPLGTLQV